MIVEMVQVSDELTREIVRALKTNGFRPTTRRLAEVADIIVNELDISGRLMEADDAVAIWCEGKQ